MDLLVPKWTHRYKSSDLFAVFDELNPDTFPDGRVGLFGFNTNFFEDNTLGVRGATSGRGLPHVTKGTLLVVFVGLKKGNTISE